MLALSPVKTLVLPFSCPDGMPDSCAYHRVGSHCHTAFLTPRHCTGAAQFAAAAVDRHRSLQCPLQYLRSTAGMPRSFITDFCPKRQSIVQQPVGLQGRYGVSTCCRELSSLAPDVANKSTLPLFPCVCTVDLWASCL